ncbi:hypothetical protein VNO78_00831 [Psophocarpus tetragonolobus]|uniref:Uncharacterized protein n=1 Tax=Psophocarpus tetragonolobus TaxID=3891 RepID=A0AAN9XV86_PSOTE
MQDATATLTLSSECLKSWSAINAFNDGESAFCMDVDSYDMDTTRVDENESNDSTSSSTLCSLNGKCPIVFVMTPAILLNCLRHNFFKLNFIKFLIMDECCHVRGKHCYACIMTEFYHHQLNSGISDIPPIFGMTAFQLRQKRPSSSTTESNGLHASDRKV